MAEVPGSSSRAIQVNASANESTTSLASHRKPPWRLTMEKIQRSVCVTVAICVLFLGAHATASAQNIGVPSEPSTREGRGPQTSSSTRRILLNLALAVLKVLCDETGDCPSTGSHIPETRGPESGEEGRYLRPSPSVRSLSAATRRRGFSFVTPTGWQIYEDQSSVTVARPSEYVNSNLTNGVILGLYDLNGGSLETGTEAYVRRLMSINRYLSRVGQPESNVVDNVPCMTARMEGQSPKTQYVEKVVVYACRRNARKLFYVVTVNSGPNAGQYEDENRGITQTISFR